MQLSRRNVMIMGAGAFVAFRVEIDWFRGVVELPRVYTMTCGCVGVRLADLRPR